MEINKNSRILITGAHGFLGQALVRDFSKNNYQNLLTPTHQELDLLDSQKIEYWLQQEKPDLVIHLAARVGGIMANQNQPATFFYENLRMGTELLHLCWKNNVSKFVGLATICAYPKLTPIPFQEENLWNGYPEETNAPYGLAKKMLLVQSQAYRQQHEYNSVILFPVNLYGPSDNFDLESSHVIPALIRKIYEAKQSNSPNVIVWGTGKPTREFLFVDDCAEAIRLASERYNQSEPVNLGSSFEISIRDLALKIKTILNYEGELVFDASKPDGQPRRKLETSRAEEFCGFKASTDFDQGLRSTIDWFLSFQS